MSLPDIVAVKGIVSKSSFKEHTRKCSTTYALFKPSSSRN